jgi:hypothetical protein
VHLPRVTFILPGDDHRPPVELDRLISWNEIYPKGRAKTPLNREEQPKRWRAISCNFPLRLLSHILSWLSRHLVADLAEGPLLEHRGGKRPDCHLSHLHNNVANGHLASCHLHDDLAVPKV